jgi:hypothetical protein
MGRIILVETDYVERFAKAFGETRGQTERFLILFGKIRFAHDDWRFLEWGKLPVCPRCPLFDFPISAQKLYHLGRFDGGADYDLAAIRPLWSARYDCGWRLELRSSPRRDSRAFVSQDSRRVKCGREEVTESSFLPKVFKFPRKEVSHALAEYP